MEYSKYQKAVFDEIEHGVSNIVIEASAGSAKTTTIIKALDYIPSDKNILFIAFNESIVKELKEKIGERNNVTVCTMHSLGRSLLKQHDISTELVENKFSKFINNNTLIANARLKLKGDVVLKLMRNLNELIGLCRNNLSRTSKDIKKVADRYGIDCKMGEVAIVKEALEWGRNNVDCIDFDDMVWLPNVLNLVPKYVKYDYIFLDEAQDANNAQIGLFLKYRKNGTRMIAVGDKNQSIYNFRGVDGTTFDKLKAMPNTKSLLLPISYRCPKSVVKYAKRYSDNIEPWELAKEGQVNKNVSVSDIKENSMVLCRNNAPLAMLYLQLLNVGKQAYMLGNEKMFESLKEMAVQSDKTLLSADLVEDGFIPQLYVSLFDNKDRWCSEDQLPPEQIVGSQRFRNQYDIVRTAEVLSRGLTTTEEFVSRIDSILNGATEGIRLSTVHKSKGMEADDVYILCDSLMPSQFAIADWEIEEEQHIQYVAYTRAKNSLNFISEIEFSSFTENKKDFNIRMKAVEKQINELTGRESKIDNELKFGDSDFVNTIVESTKSAIQENIESAITRSTLNTGSPVTRRRRR